MAPLIEVPPPNSLRGVFSIAEASASAEASSLTTIQGTTWTCRRGPVHWCMVTAIAWEMPARIAERRRIALLLEIEAAHAHAARRIDGEHELKVNLHLRCEDRSRADEQR